MEQKCFCYLDMLGFSKRIKDNPTEFALDLLKNYSTVLQQKFFEEIINPAKNYSNSKLKELAERNSVSSFDEFIAQSDSIFIVSDKASLFIEQISSFLCDSFYFTSDVFLNIKDYSYPENVDYTIIDIYTGERNKQTRLDYPLLMRGAVSYGEVIIGTTPLIHKGKLTTIPTCAGKAVVDAIRAEEIHGYGPYLFITEEFFEKLSDNEKKYVKEIDNRKYYLWTINFVSYRNDYELAKINEIKPTLVKASNLFKAYNNSQVAKYYQDFLKLCIESFVVLFNNETIISDLKEILREQNIDYSLFNLDG